MVFLSIVRQFTAKRVPMIKFRKGGPVTSASAGGAQAAAAGSPSVSGNPSGPKSSPAAAASSGPIIEDYELPPRYRRKPIDAVEMEYINRGGPPM